VRQTNPDSTTDITPQPYKQTKILEQIFHQHHGVLFFSNPLSLFLRLLSPKGPKKSLKNLLNSPSLKSVFPPKFFALK